MFDDLCPYFHKSLSFYVGKKLKQLTFMMSSFFFNFIFSGQQWSVCASRLFLQFLSFSWRGLVTIGRPAGHSSLTTTLRWPHWGILLKTPFPKLSLKIHSTHSHCFLKHLQLVCGWSLVSNLEWDTRKKSLII